MALSGDGMRLVLIALALLPCVAHGQETVLPKGMTLVGVSTWQVHSNGGFDRIWGGNLVLGINPWENHGLQFQFYFGHAPDQADSRPGMSTLGAELVFGRPAAGPAFAWPAAVGFGVVFYSAMGSDHYQSGARVGPTISVGPEFWLTQRLGVLGWIRMHLLFPSSAGPPGDSFDAAFLPGFGIAWRW